MKKAFTLVEILVGMLIMGILMGVVSLSYRDYTRRQQVSSAARQLRADLIDAQQQALAGNKKGCSGILDRYTIARISSTQYQIAVYCTGPLFSTIYKNPQLPPNIVMGNFSNFSFRPVAEGTDISGSFVTITLSASGTTYTEIITISASGGIK